MKPLIAVIALAGTRTRVRGALKLVSAVGLASAVASPAFAHPVSLARSHAAYSNGQYAGTDPDANIRASLLRELPFQRGGAD